MGRLNSVQNTSATQSYAYWPSGMRAQTLDSGSTANHRRYAYTSGGLLLGEYVQVGQSGHSSAKAAKVFHKNGTASDVSRGLGAFTAGEVATVSVWFKAPVGTTGSMLLTDNAAYPAADNKKFTALQGNGDWQQLSFSHTLTQNVSLTLHLYGDMYTSTSASATDATFVLYDDLAVSSSLRGSLLNEDFELGIGAWTPCSGNLALAQPGTAPDTWNRDVIYIGGEAVAEVDGNGVHELHSDYLGSPRVITAKATGAVEGTLAFGSYGEALPAPYTNGYSPLTGYTGHVQQDPTGLIYMRGRFYSPAWHRFLNSDQGVDPMSWNQMAYVGGSPMMAFDPSGMERKYKTDPSGNCLQSDDGGKTWTPCQGGGATVPVNSNWSNISYSSSGSSFHDITWAPPLIKRVVPKVNRYKDCMQKAAARRDSSIKSVQSFWAEVNASISSEYDEEIINEFKSSSGFNWVDGQSIFATIGKSIFSKTGIGITTYQLAIQKAAKIGISIGIPQGSLFGERSYIAEQIQQQSQSINQIYDFDSKDCFNQFGSDIPVIY